MQSILIVVTDLHAWIKKKEGATISRRRHRFATLHYIAEHEENNIILQPCFQILPSGNLSNYSEKFPFCSKHLFSHTDEFQKATLLS